MGHTLPYPKSLWSTWLCHPAQQLLCFDLHTLQNWIARMLMFAWSCGAAVTTVDCRVRVRRMSAIVTGHRVSELPARCRGSVAEATRQSYSYKGEASSYAVVG